MRLLLERYTSSTIIDGNKRYEEERIFKSAV